VLFRATTVTLAATSFISAFSFAALAFSRAMERTGMVNFVFDSSAKS